MPDVVSLIHVKRDNSRPLTDQEIGWLFAAYAGGEVADEQMAALLMAIYFNGLDGAELRAWTGEMIASGERLDLSRPAQAVGGQALHRRRRRQGVAGAGAAGGELRRGGADAVGARPRAHRRHPGQARVDPRLARQPRQRGADRRAGEGRRGDRRRRARPGAGRPQAVRAARRDRDGRVDPADRQLDHVQEDRRGNRRAGARRQDRVRRLHAGAGAGAATSPGPWSRSARSTASAPGRSSPGWTRRSAAPSATPSRSRRRSRAARRGPGGPDGGHLRARRADAASWRASTPTRGRRSPAAARSTPSGR